MFENKQMYNGTLYVQRTWIDGYGQLQSTGWEAVPTAMTQPPPSEPTSPESPPPAMPEEPEGGGLPS